MSKTIKRALSLFLCAALLFGALPLTAVHAADPTFGTWGDNLTWHYDAGTATLTISGEGEMNIERLGNYPWNDYQDKIKTVNITNGVTSIGDDAFFGAKKMEEVTIPATVVYIGYRAFYNCAELKEISIPENVSIIGEGAFYGSALTCVTIPKSVQTIGSSAFFCGIITDDAFTPTLKRITVDSLNNSYASVDNVLYSKDKRELIQYPLADSRSTFIVPAGVTHICGGAFSACTGLTSVLVSNSVTSIGDFAFSSCTGLTSVTIPDSVTSIGEMAFSMCTNLDFLHIPSSVTSIGFLSFYETSPLFFICSDTANCYAKTYAESNGIEFRVCSGHGTGCALNGHTPKVVRIEPTCTNPGAEYTICEACGETISGITTIPANGHTPGDWQTVKEPTETETGKAEKRCTVCGEKLEEKELPKLEVVKDETTGIELSYSGGDYNGDVSVNVEQSFDGAAFNLVNTQTGAVQQAVYDITLSVNGAETQPNGKIRVKIPVPAGYDPAKTFVYHVNTATGKLEKMNAVYENGFMVFETDHFSFYAIVEAAPKVTKVELGDVTMNYKDSVTLKPTITADPGAEYTVKYESSNPKVATVDANGKVTGAKRGSATITCTVTDAAGNTVKDTCKVTVKYTVLQWIIIILLFGWIWY